jgi:hypothetical protein
MYHGEVTMNNDSLPGFLKTAEALHIRGLTNRVVPIHEVISSQRSKVTYCNCCSYYSCFSLANEEQGLKMLEVIC